MRRFKRPSQKSPVKLPAEQLPKHVAIIMDGNGRWAKKRLLPRQAGHVAGMSALRKTVTAAEELGISCLTVYAFSTENWQRPATEVKGLMSLFRRFFRADVADMNERNVRLRFIGGRKGLPGDIAEMIEEGEAMTKANTGLTLMIAFNYGAREELLSATRVLAQKVAAKQIEPEAISEDLFSTYLHTAGVPDVDLVIRPGGEKRISNFLLWQAAYAEFVFIDTLWPDFSDKQFHECIAEYASRERRFGKLAPDEADAGGGETADASEG